MATCPTCSHPVLDDDRFCHQCGAPIQADAKPATASLSATAALEASRRRPAWRVGLTVGLAAMVGVFGFVFMGKGCSEVEGAFQAAGPPLGTFTFTPTQCRSGERMQFFGAVLLGEGPTDGGILVGEDPVQGRFVKVEVPGSCKPPDYEVCTEILVKPESCSTFEASVSRTGVQVNDIRVVEGHLKLDCRFPEGGSATAALTFSGCG